MQLKIQYIFFLLLSAYSCGQVTPHSESFDSQIDKGTIRPGGVTLTIDLIGVSSVTSQQEQTISIFKQLSGINVNSMPFNECYE